MPSKRRALQERRRAGLSSVEEGKRVVVFFRRLTPEEELYEFASWLDEALVVSEISELPAKPLSSLRVAVCVVV